jgi:ABC-type bacteriocin/lantibiotic exporter with double-glycine peptidase domain
MAPRLALVAAIAFALFSVGLGQARRSWKQANARAAEHREALLTAADEAVRHAELWTTYGAERRVRSHLAAIGRALVTQGARIDASAAALSGANEVLGATALLLAIIAGRAGWLGASGADAVLLPFAVTFFLAYRPIRDLTDARLALLRAAVAGDALAPLFAAADRAHEQEAANEDAPEPPEWTLAALEVEGIRLHRGVAKELSFRVAPGTVLAVVGATGSGKTTLLRALLGLEVPLAGTIRYGDLCLDPLPSGPASRPFAWVPQDAPILADTLDANIALASRSTDPRAALQAIGATSLSDAVGDARLGAGGWALSGGERQWVALARAVATRLPVLLLDEPTSGLDGLAQARVLEAIARLKGSRTVIMVTHREEPLSIADAIVQMDAPVAATTRAA